MVIEIIYFVSSCFNFKNNIQNHIRKFLFACYMAHDSAQTYDFGDFHTWFSRIRKFRTEMGKIVFRT